MEECTSYQPCYVSDFQMKNIDYLKGGSRLIRVHWKIKVHAGWLNKNLQYTKSGIIHGLNGISVVKLEKFHSRFQFDSTLEFADSDVTTTVAFADSDNTLLLPWPIYPPVHPRATKPKPSRTVEIPLSAEVDSTCNKTMTVNVYVTGVLQKSAFASFVSDIELEETIDRALSCVNMVVQITPQSPTNAYESMDLSKLFEEGHFSDITFVLRGSELKAHKCILATHSPVFLEMFNTSSKKDVTITIDDVNFDAMYAFLQYMYTNGLPEVDYEDLKVLITLSDRYAVPSLKKLCSKILTGMLKVENAVKILAIAESHELENLTKKAIEVITKNIEKFDESSFLSLKVHLVTKIMMQVVKKKKKHK